MKEARCACLQRWEGDHPATLVLAFSLVLGILGSDLFNPAVSAVTVEVLFKVKKKKKQY